MKNIEFVRRSGANNEYIEISYEDAGKQCQSIITDPLAIEIIITLGQALQKPSFLKANPSHA